MSPQIARGVRFASRATRMPPVQRESAFNPLTRDDVSNIEGTTVYGGDDVKVGHVSTVLTDSQTRKIDRLVVTAGGMLGMGGHRIALPLDQFKWDADKGAFRLPTALASLKWMPGMGRRHRDGHRVKLADTDRITLDRRGRRRKDLQIVSRSTS
jgi:hypothetical protein